MIARKSFVIVAGLLLTSSAFGYFLWYKPKFDKHAAKDSVVFTSNSINESSKALVRMEHKATLAKDYVAGHGFNSKYCFLLDMRIASGKNRFFVFNLEKNSIELAGLVTHGSGSDKGEEALVFSNTPNSYCTSLGRYKIGKGYNGSFGQAYKLHGLDKTNSKAFDRFVVLHGHSCVPDKEPYPGSICLSLGCPTVSPVFLTRLTSYIDKSKEPILLWIYY